MNGIIYCRVSSKEQVKGTSLESQEASCREYASRQGINVLRVFVEEGESAKFADRTQLLELLEFCRDGQKSVQVLLVWKLDRLARNVGDHFNIKASLLKHNVRVVSVTEPIDSNPEGKLLETILAGFAQFDNELRATRSIQGMRRKIQEGIFPWGPPLGYKSVNPPRTKKTHPDEPDQPTFRLLQRVWNEFATGAHTKAEMLRLMQRWNVRTRTGRPICKQSLDFIFVDPYYAGIIRDPWSGQEYAGKHLPMVSRDVFARVQEVIHRRNRSIRHQRIRPEFPLRMFARCDSCSHYMTGSLSRGRSKYYPYYHCFNDSCGSGTNHGSSAVHEEFESYLDDISPNRQAIEGIADDLAVAIKARAKTAATLADRRGSEMQRLEEQQRRLLEMSTDGLITQQEFIAHRELLRQRLSALHVSERNVVFQEEIIGNQIATICEPLSNLRATWNEIEPALKQRFQRLILPTGFVIGRVGTAEMGCFFSSFRTGSPTKSNGVAPAGQFWNQVPKLVEEIDLFAKVLFPKQFDTDSLAA